MEESFLKYFYDPVLRAPTIGSMLMCFSTALVGVMAFLRRESLLGESLAHAAYPGMMAAACLLGVFSFDTLSESTLLLSVLIGAFCSALLGLHAILFLEQRLRLPSDAALCFILSAFFGVGITIASHLQFTHTTLYTQAQSYLFGQVATMQDGHIVLYGLLACATLVVVLLFYKQWHLLLFDRQQAQVMGFHVKLLEALLACLIVFAVVIGLRCVGVVLISGMLIAPAVAARGMVKRLLPMLCLAACFGVLSGFFGNYFSLELSTRLSVGQWQRFSLPAGPMIVTVAAFFCLITLLFAPQEGLFARLLRTLLFHQRCLRENLLKSLWHFGVDHPTSLQALMTYQQSAIWRVRLSLFRLCRQGWVRRVGKDYQLTQDGEHKAARIVRLHRLWELYLVDYLGVGAERVHYSAEEMEHVITPELEHALTAQMHHPTLDPHHQPIPGGS